MCADFKFTRSNLVTIEFMLLIT